MGHTEWIELNSKLFSDQLKISENNYGGVKHREYLSPYDIPEAIRSYIEGENFYIDIRYISNEPITQRIEDNIILNVGKNSQRIYSIIVNAKKIETNGLSGELTMIDKAIDKYNSLINRGHDLTKSAIKAKSENLFQLAG